VILLLVHLVYKEVLLLADEPGPIKGHKMERIKERQLGTFCHIIWPKHPNSFFSQILGAGAGKKTSVLLQL